VDWTESGPPLPRDELENGVQLLRSKPSTECTWSLDSSNQQSLSWKVAKAVSAQHTSGYCAEKQLPCGCTLTMGLEKLEFLCTFSHIQL
jgi:hypothetical protein